MQSSTSVPFESTSLARETTTSTKDYLQEPTSFKENLRHLVISSFLAANSIRRNLPERTKNLPSSQGQHQGHRRQQKRHPADHNLHHNFHLKSFFQ